jgi:hypothetical protein
MRTHTDIRIAVPDVLLPREGTDLTRWAVIACDQHTSEPAYWEQAAALVGDAPSTLNLIYPEVYLSEAQPEERIARIRETMRRYVAEERFREVTGFVYLERTVGAHVRRGLVLCLDLEAYDFRKGSTSPIRATEGTIVERLPPRVRIREGATIELPHIMVLVDDPRDTVIGPLAAAKAKLAKLYDFELMLGSGHLEGHLVGDAALEAGVVRALAALADPEVFAASCGVPAGTPVLHYAMGDGNHSLATAKTIWESAKAAANGDPSILESPLRWALVEIVNLHDPALVFEPIHRVVFELEAGHSVQSTLEAHYPGRVTYRAMESFEAVKAAVDAQQGPAHLVGLCTSEGFGVLEVAAPDQNLPVGTLQAALDALMKAKGARELDYVHGAEPVVALGTKPGNAGLYLPGMKKQDLFRTVVLDGALPRKTFSMGEAWEKRFYLEARRIG